MIRRDEDKRYAEIAHLARLKCKRVKNKKDFFKCLQREKRRQFYED